MIKNDRQSILDSTNRINTDSDVDILVDSGLKGLSFFGLLEDVSVSLDKNIDMIDTTQIAKNSEIDMEISKNGVQIYG